MATAWGKAEVHYAEAETDGTMPEALTKIGRILDGTTSFENEAGEVLELKEEGGAVVDTMTKDGKLKLKFTLIDIPAAARTAFWTADGKAIKSMTNSKKFAMKLLFPDVPEAETFEIPYSSVTMGIGYSTSQGYTAEVEVTALKHPTTGAIFSFGE